MEGTTRLRVEPPVVPVQWQLALRPRESGEDGARAYLGRGWRLQPVGIHWRTVAAVFSRHVGGRGRAIEKARGSW